MIWSFGPAGKELNIPGYEAANMLALPMEWATREIGIPSWTSSQQAVDAFGQYLDPQGDYVPGDPYYLGWFKARVQGSMFAGMSPFAFEGRPISPWALGLNEVLHHGSDALAFIAKVAATHELHCMIEGPQRRWAAEMLNQGIEEGLLRVFVPGTDRRTSHWQELIHELLEDPWMPVVLSGSMTEPFPEPPQGWRAMAPADYPDDKAYDKARDERYERWTDLTDEQQFALGVAALRDEPASGDWNPPLSAENMRAVTFRHTLRYTDLIENDEAKVRAALAGRTLEDMPW